ncbi:MAG: hypothetical protein IJR94_05910 [Synergistaceae bacterium]|nr:hypothetical protein [Synergistaceae bacterium]
MVSQNGKVIFRIKDPEEDWTKPRLRVQEFLEKHRQDAFTVEELMNKCSVSKPTVYYALKAMGLKSVGEKASSDRQHGPAEKLYTAGMEDRQIYLDRS